VNNLPDTLPLMERMKEEKKANSTFRVLLVGKSHILLLDGDGDEGDLLTECNFRE
jgi:hypothetical protein